MKVLWERLKGTKSAILLWVKKQILLNFFRKSFLEPWGLKMIQLPEKKPKLFSDKTIWLKCVVAKSTKPKSATSYKETAFGIISRSQLVPLEAQGVKKALEYIIKISDTKPLITPDLIKDIHKVGFGLIFPNWAGRFRLIEVTVGSYNPPQYH